MLRNAIVLVLGKKGSGKTTLVQKTVCAQCAPLVIIDPVYDYDDFGAVLTVDEFESLLETAPSELPVVVLQDSQDELERAFEICYGLRPHTIVIDEVHRFVNPWYMSEGLELLIREGRHRQINIIAISQGAREIPELFLAQCDALVLFQQKGKRDFQKLSHFADDEQISRIQTLPPFEYVYVPI